MRPSPPTWVDLPVSSSRWARSMPTHVPVGQLEPAVDVDRLVVLADLEVLRHVRVEVVLPGEDRRADLAVEGQPEADGQLDRLLVEHRQRARAGRAHRVDVGVGLVAELVGRAREHLRGGGQLGVHLEADRPVSQPSTRGGRVDHGAHGAARLERRPPPGTGRPRRARAPAPARRRAGRRRRCRRAPRWRGRPTGWTGSCTRRSGTW